MKNTRLQEDEINTKPDFVLEETQLIYAVLTAEQSFLDIRSYPQASHLANSINGQIWAMLRDERDNEVTFLYPIENAKQRT